MTESSGEKTATATPYPDDCPDPVGPYTDYRVAVSVAKKRSDLYTADTAVIEPKYQKLKDAQARYQTAWTAQRTAWEDLKCRLKRIKETLEHAVEEGVRQHLWDCWTQVGGQTDPTAGPVNCAEIDELDCDELEDLLEEDDRPTAEQIGRLRQQDVLAGQCVTQVDADYDTLAGFPEGLQAAITDLTSRATTLEQELAAPGNDPRRSWVVYLALNRDVQRLKHQLTTAAEYACTLKARFVHLLDTHETAICIKVVLHAIDERDRIEAADRQERAGSIVDLVLECALKAPTSESATPAQQQAEQKYEQKSEQRSQEKSEKETPAAGAGG
jgi:hypothetical protein